MNNLPPNSGNGPPRDATNVVLTGLLRDFTDQQSMMPLPAELLQFVGMHNPELADALYHLRLNGNTPPQGLTGAVIEDFMRNWTPSTDPTTGAATHPAMAIWSPPAAANRAANLSLPAHAAGPVPSQPPTLASAPPSSAAPDVLLMTPVEPVATDMSTPENAMTFTLSAGPPPSLYTSAPSSESVMSVDFVVSSDSAGENTQTSGQRSVGESEQGPHLFRILPDGGALSDGGAVPRTASDVLPGGTGSEPLVTGPPAQDGVVDAVPEPMLNLDWMTIPSPSQGPIIASHAILADGMYDEWNRVCVSFQMVAGHVDRGHVEPGGAGCVNVLEYIIWKIYSLGILPQSDYIEEDPAHRGWFVDVPVALRDQRNFWAQFYYFTRYVFTEQLLRTKAVISILIQQEEARRRHQAAETGGRPGAPRAAPINKPKMGPNYWWVFGRQQDPAWETYFKHIFRNQALPEYLRPWFAQADGPLAPTEEEAAASSSAAAAPGGEDEKENDAPAEEFQPDLMSYDTVYKMHSCLEAVGRLLYPGTDRPSRAESDNLLPKMFFDNLVSLAAQCLSYHPWRSPSVPVVHLGLRRLRASRRDSPMNPLEFYGSAQ